MALLPPDGGRPLYCNFSPSVNSRRQDWQELQDQEWGSTRQQRQLRPIRHPCWQHQPELDVLLLIPSPAVYPSSSPSRLSLHQILLRLVSLELWIRCVMWGYMKNSYAELNGTTDRRLWMKRSLMQSMVKAQSVSKENEPGVSKCICLSLICAVREKHLLMKGTCLPLDPTGKAAHWSLWRSPIGWEENGSGVKSWLTWNLSGIQCWDPVTSPPVGLACSQE